jgi:MFS family permease
MFAAKSTLDTHGQTTGQASHGYTIGVFFICFMFSYIDRQIVSILVQPLKQALVLSDAQIGLLQGFAFTLCYATAGVFVARMVDRSNRVRLSAACVAIWAISTAMCGTAHSFGELLFWRAGTAIAEAALSPAALSIFSDLFPPRKVSRASSIFMLGPFAGGGVALLGGGLLLGWLGQPSNQAWQAQMALQPWQVVFISVGLPGILLAAIILLTVCEPARIESHHHADGNTLAASTANTPSLAEVLRELFLRNPFCLPYFAAYVALILLFYSHAAWFPTLLIRHFGLTASNVGQYAGPAYMIGGMAGVISAGFLVRKASDQQALFKSLKTASRAACALVPLALTAPLVPSFALAVLLYGACAYAASIVMALAPIPLQVAIPNRMRGRSIALLVFLTNAISGGLGPFAVGYLNQSFHTLDNSLGVALTIVGATAAIASSLLYGMACRRVAVARQSA